MSTPGGILEETVSSVSDLVAAAKKRYRKSEKRRDAQWYRGHAVAAWKLVPSVHRRCTHLDEVQLVNRFKLMAPTRHREIPGDTDLPRWLCLMQHYGLPTRLLDWTASLPTAAFFALAFEDDKHLDEDAAIWQLDPQVLNGCDYLKKQFVFQVIMPPVSSLASDAFSMQAAPIAQVAAVTGPDVDIRMAVQQGSFTIHGDPTPLEDHADAKDFLVKLIVPAAAKKDLAEELRLIGIRRSALFPDLVNLAKELAGDYPMDWSSRK